MASNATSNGTHNPYLQTFNLLTRDKDTVTFSIADLDDIYYYSVRISINYAAQLGASLMLLITIGLLTKTDKFPSPVFLLNVGSLAINFVRLLLTCLFYAGDWSEIYAVLSNDFSAVPEQAYRNSVAAIVLTLILVVLIQISLFLQMQVVCVTLPKLYRRGLLVVSLAVGLQAVIVRLVYAVHNAQSVYTGDPIEQFEWLESAANITVTVSICWFCAAFVAKLGFAIRQRRKLGLRKWGPMNVIFVMGCQTLLIPALFSILQYFGSIPAASSNMFTLTVIFLPLSSMWASSTIAGQSRASRPLHGLQGQGKPLAPCKKHVDTTSTDWTASIGSPMMEKHMEAEAAQRV